MHQFTQVVFRHFKAFRSFTLRLRHFNILVGPNNAGKSTILAAFRVLAAGMRTANQFKPQIVPSPDGEAFGYVVDLSAISIGEENIFFEYDDSSPASVNFKMSNGNELELYFPERGACFLLPNAGRAVRSPTEFRREFNAPIGFVPILGPVEHKERLFDKEAARLALFSYGAARNFRNIWYHYPERFDKFRALLAQTWPGMDVEPPITDFSHGKPVLYMFGPEERIPREVFWSGFGFQVWCQMLTHVVQSSEVSIFLIDEPDIYLHSDLQRQLIGRLRNLGPDVVIATHSTEIITESEPDDIVLVDKRKQSARRLKDPSQLGQVFQSLGSNLNPILTQLAKSRRAVFVEGKDFQIFSRFGRKLALSEVASRGSFAVVPVEGFSPDRIRSLRRGIEVTLGGKIVSAAILDRDYRSIAECKTIGQSCESEFDLFRIHTCKEVENFLLVPAALDRAAANRLKDRARRTGSSPDYSGSAKNVLMQFAEAQKNYVMSQFLARSKQFERSIGSSIDEAAANQRILEEFELDWAREERRLAMIPGKDGFSALNKYLQSEFGISLTPTAVIDAITPDEVPAELKSLLYGIEVFAKKANAS